jgi:hypothetical protein
MELGYNKRVMKKTTESWGEYLANKNVRPKTFNLTVRRNRGGEFEILGFNAFMKNDMGGAAEWVRVDARDIARAIRNGGIVAK